MCMCKKFKVVVVGLTRPPVARLRLAWRSVLFSLLYIFLVFLCKYPLTGFDFFKNSKPLSLKRPKML